MGDVIYVSSNSFKTTQADALERLGDPNIYIQLRSDPVVISGNAWDVFSSVFSDINVPQDWSSITGSAGTILTEQEAWDAYKQIERLSVVSVGGGLTQFVKLVRVVSATAITGFVLAVVADQMSHAWASWSGGTVPNNQIPDDGNTGNGSVIIPLNTGSGDILGTGMLLNDLYLETEDPTQFLIQIFDEDGVLITSGYPNAAGYFDPKFVDSEWADITFSSGDGPVDQLPGHVSVGWELWPPPNAIQLLAKYSESFGEYVWATDSICYEDPNDPTTEEESSGSGDGTTFAEAIEVIQDGGSTTPVDATGYGNSLELGEREYFCDGGDSAHKVWFYTDYDGGGTGLNTFVHDDDFNILNIELFIDFDGTVAGLELYDATCNGDFWGVSVDYPLASAGRYYIRATAAVSGNVANVGCMTETLDGGGGEG